MAKTSTNCRYKIDDPEFKKLQHLQDAGNKAFGELVLFDFVPFAKYLPITRLPIFKKVKDVMEGFKEVRTREIQEHRRTLAEGEPEILDLEALLDVLPCS